MNGESPTSKFARWFPGVQDGQTGHMVRTLGARDDLTSSGGIIEQPIPALGVATVVLFVLVYCSRGVGYWVDIFVILSLKEHSPKPHSASICLKNEGTIRTKLRISQHSSGGQGFLELPKGFLAFGCPLKDSILFGEGM